MGVDGVRGIDPLDGVGEGGGSGEVPSDPREGNGSVDCRKVRQHISCVEMRSRMFDEVTSSSKESPSSWRKWKMARGGCDL